MFNFKIKFHTFWSLKVFDGFCFNSVNSREGKGISLDVMMYLELKFEFMRRNVIFQ